MGIPGLLPYLDTLKTNVSIQVYAGSCAAIDAPGWLYSGAKTCALHLATGVETTQYVDYIVKRLEVLQKSGVYPVMVFDGCPHPSKKETNLKRRTEREAAKEKGLELLKEGKEDEAEKAFMKAVTVTDEMIQKVIKECYARGVGVVVAPYEADAQLTYMVNEGIVDFVITEDSDLLPFGCKRVLFKMDANGSGVEIKLSDLFEDPRFEGWSQDKFRQMCVLSGCDYLDHSLPRHSVEVMHDQFAEFEDVEEGIKGFIARQCSKPEVDVDEEFYFWKFQEADQAVTHHLIFELESGSMTPLNPLPSHLTLEELAFVIGKPFEDPTRAVQQACGNINPHSGQKTGDFEPKFTELIRHIKSKEWMPPGIKPLYHVQATRKIIVPVDSTTAANAVRDHIENQKYLGFGCHGNTSKSAGTLTVIDIATPKAVVLFQTKEYDLPASLRDILNNREILKVGVNIGSDAERLKKHCGLDLEGWVDLQWIALKNKSYAKVLVSNVKEYDEKIMKKDKEKTEYVRWGKRYTWTPKLGLPTLSEEILGQVLRSKALEKACGKSKWESSPLTDKHKVFAATTGAASLDVFLALGVMAEEELGHPIDISSYLAPLIQKKSESKEMKEMCLDLVASVDNDFDLTHYREKPVNPDQSKYVKQ